MNIYVGNLSDGVTDDDLRKAFEKFGEILSASVIKDRYTGSCRGFGFVEMYDVEQAKQAIAALNGTQLKGQAITVNEARPKTESSSRAAGGRTGTRRPG